MPSNFQDGDLIEAGHLKQYSGEAYYSVAGGGSTSSAYVATVTPAPLSGYPVGMVINFKPNADNAASPTLNVNGLGAKAIVKNGSTPLAAADLKNGQVVSLIYDGTNFQLVAASAGGGSSVTDLNSLTDVTISGASTGQVLRKSAGDWVNSAIQAGDLPTHNHDGSQITTGQVAPARLSSNAPNSSQFLRGDGTWAAVSGGASDLNGLTDVTITTPATGQFVRKSAGDWVNSGIQAGDLPAGIDAANIGAGTVSNTEFGYLDGVTSAIQTQLNGKAATSHTHAASDITSGQMGLARGGTGADLSATGGAGQVLKQSTAGGAVSVGALGASDMPSGIDAAKIGGGAVSNAEFGYLDGVTSAIQTQLNGKAATSHTHAASDITSGSLAVARGGTGLSALGTALQALRVNAAGTALEYFTASGGTPTAYCCVVSRSTNKGWGAIYVQDAINWDTEIIDTSSMHDTSVNNDRIYLNQAGKWFIFCSLGYANNSATGNCPWMGAHLYKNTTQVAYAYTRIGSLGYSEMHSHIAQVVTSNGSSDYVQLKAQTDDYTKGVLSADRTQMMAIFLGA